jgi:hypothetical protein
MTAEKLRELFKRQVAEAAVDIFPSFIQELRNSEDPDQMRKFLAMAAEVNGWKDPPPKNAMDNLPVFNFNFSGTGVTVETTMPDGSTQSIEVTQNAQPAKPAEQLDVIEIVTPAGVPPGTPPAQPGMLKLDGEMFDLDSLLADD